MGLRTPRELRSAAVVQNRYLENPDQGLELIANLISMPEQNEAVGAMLTELKRLIEDKFTMICSEIGMPGESRQYKKLLKAYEDLEDLTEFSALANMNIVAVGGGFSAGKSRFLNSLLDDDILPTDTTPTTAIPTYIRKGEEEQIYALNTFNLKAKVDREAVKAISHAFKAKYNSSFYHFIKLLTVEKPGFKYDNIAFLDTPGYSKPDSLDSGGNVDEQKAREHLSQADYLIWVTEVTDGTLQESDIVFLNSLEKKDMDIFVVVNKADKLPRESVAAILAIVRQKLQDAGFKVRGVGAYSSLLEPKEVMGDSVSAYLEQINGRVKFTRLKKDFESVIVSFQQHLYQKMAATKEVTALFNEMMLKNQELLSPDEQKKMKEHIHRVQKEQQKANQSHAQLIEFQKRLDELVDRIVAKIKVNEEKVVAAGLTSIIQVKDDQAFARLQEGGKLKGTVHKLDCFGVYLQCDLGEGLIHKGDIAKKYTVPLEEAFRVGETLDLAVAKIKYDKKEVTLTVIPTKAN